MRKTLLALLTVIISLSAISLMSVTYAQQPSSLNSVCSGLGGTTGQSGCTPPTGTPDLNTTITTAVNILSVIVGIIAVVMVIVGGAKFITSGGEASNVASAKNTILYAVVGLIIVAFAQIIVHFVLSKIHKAT